MVKRMVTNGHLPNVANTAVEFVDYPPAMAVWLKYVSDFVGFADATLYFAQAMVFFAAIFALLPLCEKKWYGVLAVSGFGLYMMTISCAYRILTVDGILTVLCVGAVAVIMQNRSSPRRALLQSLPVLMYLCITKNSGIFFVIAAALWLLAVNVSGPKPWLKKTKLVAMGIGLPLFTWWIWGQHVKLVFPEGMNSKHAVSAQAYGSSFAQKTPEEIAQFNQSFMQYWFDLNENAVLRFWISLAMFAGILIILAAARQISVKLAVGYGAAGLVLTMAYIASLWGTYAFSMNTNEMLVLASITRYSRSFFDCLLAAGIILILVYCKKTRLQGALALTVSTMLFGMVFMWGSLSSLLTPAKKYAEAARQNMWLNEKQQYNLQENARYLVYTNGEPMDGWAERYVGRYALNTDVLDFWQFKEEAPNLNLLVKDYDYFLHLKPDDYSMAELERWGFDPGTHVLEAAELKSRLDELSAQGLAAPK